MGTTSRQRHYILAWRKFRRLTQEEVAERITAMAARNGGGKEITYSTYGRLERGLSHWTEHTLPLIAEVMETTPNALISLPPYDLNEVRDIWESLDHEHQELAIRFLRALATDNLRKNGCGDTL